ncbi:MAG TPA: hypothetical protein VLX09_09690 [Stellaceae bacterium]|nr:hypothetical protein [Stellaceae bacterium]
MVFVRSNLQMARIEAAVVVPCADGLSYVTVLVLLAILTSF